MSKIATEYGATIDKYVGDAIVMFFGDPETRGVKQDALAAVKMAIAMQKRNAELGEVWRDAGIQTPLRCRIGIHTDFCTVGNFGSADRMDYTIVGGAVNLASRLEHEATPGSVLISYETYANVKDEIVCEEQGNISVRGIAYPVMTYRVVDLKSNLSADKAAIRKHIPHLSLELQPALMSAKELGCAKTRWRWRRRLDVVVRGHFSSFGGFSIWKAPIGISVVLGGSATADGRMSAATTP